MIQSRKTMLASAFGLFTFVSSTKARAADSIPLQLGIDVASSHPMAVRATEAAAKTKRDTNGRLDITVFANGSLGTDTSMLTQVRSGALPLMLISDSILANVVTIAALENVPFAFPSYKQAFEALDGPMGTTMRAAMKPAGLYGFEKAWCSGYKQMINSVRPINSPDDVKGLKLRIAPNALEVAMLKALGASAVPINLGEAYAALQSHLVDGLTLVLPVLESQKFYEVQKYVAMTNHLFTAFSLLANADHWQAVPAELRQIAETNFNASALAERNDIVASDKTLERTLESQGLSFSHPNLTAFHEALRKAGMYIDFRDKFGAANWALLEATTGPLT